MKQFYICIKANEGPTQQGTKAKQFNYKPSTYKLLNCNIDLVNLGMGEGTISKKIPYPTKRYKHFFFFKKISHKILV